MGKAFAFFTLALTVLAAGLQCGCGRESGPAREAPSQRVPAAAAPSGIPGPADIPVYPGAERVETEMLPGFMEQGLTVAAYRTSDTLSRVYSFYAGALEEMGFDAPGSMSIGNGSHFVFRVSLDGGDIAVINGSVEDGNTIIAVVRPG